jgi:hypothetical protein
MTLCVSLRIEAGTETCLRQILVSRGSQRNSQNSGSSVTNQSHLASSRISITLIMMARIDHMLRILDFQGMGLEDPEKHLFVCNTISNGKNV